MKGGFFLAGWLAGLLDHCSNKNNCNIVNVIIDFYLLPSLARLWSGQESPITVAQRGSVANRKQHMRY